MNLHLTELARDGQSARSFELTRKVHEEARDALTLEDNADLSIKKSTNNSVKKYLKTKV